MATKSRKKSASKTVAQQVVGTAATGMPGPVKGIVASRWGARITIVVVGLALATGVLTVKWDGKIPHFAVDRKRAQEVREELREKVQDVAQKHDEKKPGHLLPVKITR